MTTQTIQVISAPVVMVTVCRQMANGFLIRYTNLTNRLRPLAHECLEPLQTLDAMTAFQPARLAKWMPNSPICCGIMVGCTVHSCWSI